MITKCNPRIPTEEGISLSYELMDLLDKLITYPDRRLTMKEIQIHPWLLDEKIERYKIFLSI